MSRPLEGIRVLEWGIFHAGPGGPAILADMGAEVIKIEQVGVGDPIRHMSGYKNIDFSLGEDSNMFFEGSNRGKKSITLNLEHKEGRQIAYDLVKKSDVFFTNLRVNTIEKMEMDYLTLSKINPNIIYASVTSYGTQGPDADQGGFDFQGQARAGLMHSIGEPDMTPLLAQFGIADQATAIMASYQVIIALLIRERTGIGQKVDISLLGTVSYLMYFNNLVALLSGIDVPRHEQANADPLRNYYRCKDDKWLILTDNPRFDNWEIICELLDCPELAKDTRFSTREGRMEYSREIVAVINNAFLNRSRDEWLKIFREKKIIMCSVNTSMEAIKDNQMIENKYIVDYDHPTMGKIKIPGFPIGFSESKINNNLSAPKLGEHTEMILSEISGLSKEEISRLKSENII